MTEAIAGTIVDTWTVPKRGTGRPDYSPIITTGKPTVGKDQKKWELLVTRRACDGNAIAAGSCATVSAYTVPSGYQLHIGGAVITCNASCLQKVIMAHTPGIIGDYRYDVKGELIFGPLSSTIIGEGDTLTIYIYNLDEVARDFSITMIGVLEKI